MTSKTKNEYAKEVAKRYLNLKTKSRKEKSKILDEFCATTRYNRKHAIAKLRSINFKDPPKKQRTRKKIYSKRADVALIQIWESFGCICAERLHPFLSEAISKLEQFGYLKVSPEVRKELLSISRSSIGRRISKHKELNIGKAFSTTKPGSLLKKHIPIQTKSWDTNKAGFLEMDLVAHCGGSLQGDFINTLQAVDIKTTWTERVAVMGKSQKVVFEGIKKIKRNLPFSVLGVDSDNGSEFINQHLWRYCREKGIQFTRSRPYMKKDNAHIEQKNWTLVRKILGYDRFDTNHQLMLINDLYDNELRLFINFFQPSLKLASKERYGAKIKRKYDGAKTPYQRVLDCDETSKEKKEELKKIYNSLDPIKLKKEIDRKINTIISLLRLDF